MKVDLNEHQRRALDDLHRIEVHRASRNAEINRRAKEAREAIKAELEKPLVRAVRRAIDLGVPPTVVSASLATTNNGELYRLLGASEEDEDV